jgi:hypothetical protein
MRDQAAAIEVGFFQALRDNGVELKVAMQLYDECITTMVKSAAFRLRLPEAPKLTLKPGEFDIHAGARHPETGMTDILGKPQFAHMAPKPSVVKATTLPAAAAVGGGALGTAVLNSLPSKPSN